MEHIVDARGQDCPQPVIMTKQALEDHSRIVVYVDNTMAVENVRRLGVKLGCEVTIEALADGSTHLHLSRAPGAALAPGSAPEEIPACTVPGSGSYVVALTADIMGQGSEELGRLLMKAFIHTLLQAEELPQAMVCYNAGVKLAALGADTLEDMQQLEGLGVKILLCGTCVNYFSLGGQTGAGEITNMFEILNTLAMADRTVKP